MPRAALSTTDLFTVLRRSTDDLSSDLLRRDTAVPFNVHLSELMRERELDAADIGKAALLSRPFAYQICSGARAPGRDIVIRLALVLSLDLKQTQRLLTLAGRNVLYPRVSRDAVIIHAIEKKYDLFRTDEMLSSLGHKTLL